MNNTDKVMHPDHYTQGGVECIEAIKASMDKQAFCAYCKGNVMKYLWRYEHKDGLCDLEKAEIYLHWMIVTKKEIDEEMAERIAKWRKEQEERDAAKNASGSTGDN